MGRFDTDHVESIEFNQRLPQIARRHEQATLKDDNADDPLVVVYLLRKSIIHIRLRVILQKIRAIGPAATRRGIKDMVTHFNFNITRSHNFQADGLMYPFIGN